MKLFKMTFNAAGTIITVHAANISEGYQKAKAAAFEQKLNVMPSQLKLTTISNAL